MPIWSTSQISFGRIFQVLPALSKIINNDTEDIISTPAMKLSTDPDAQDLKLTSSSLIWVIQFPLLLFHSRWVPELVTETVILENIGIAEFLMKDSSRSRRSECCIKLRRKKFHILENFSIFIHLLILQIATELPLSAKHDVWCLKKTQEPCSRGTHSQVQETTREK